MERTERYGTFDTLAQRVACSYVRSLCEFRAVMPAGLDAGQQLEMETSQHELHAFFQVFYTKLCQSPELFGLPLGPDDCFTGEDTGKAGTKKKAELNKKLQKPRDMIADGLDFLMLAGQQGDLRERALLLPADIYLAYLKGARARKAFLKGMESVGLETIVAGPSVVITSAQFPAMMPALKALASACSNADDKKLGKFNFARCDFRAFDPRYHPSAIDLYHVFHPADYQRVALLHQFFSGLGYQPVFQIYGIFGWEVQYQGKRQIKSSPLLRIEYQERYRYPLSMNLKCASANRITPLVSRQPRFLQEDFSHRVNTCGNCDWCKNKKSLGPSLFEFDGVQKQICWYTNGNVDELDDDSVRLIEQYAIMHEELG